MLRADVQPAVQVSNDSSYPYLLKRLFILGLPIAAENFLHIFVGLTDTYLANQLDNAAGAAVGATAYVLWFLGLMTGSIGTGSTAVISRAYGARDRSTARAAVGQSFLLAAAVGVVLGTLLLTLAGPAGGWFGLEDPQAQAYITQFTRIVGIGVPLAVFTFIGNACLRGAGDTITPMLAMIVIDVTNVLLSFGLVYGWGPLPQLGFTGIAWGTTIAYGGGAFVVLAALLWGKGPSKLRLLPHRLRPDVPMIRRLLKIGIPSGVEGLSFWGANFVVLWLIGRLGTVPAAAHGIVVRVEAFSYMTGFAVSTAAATMVGISLGMKNPLRAKRAGTLAFGVGAVFMVGCGLMFFMFSRTLCGWFTNEEAVAAAAGDALRVAALSQLGFAAMMVFGGALRGAGDTTAVMVRNLGSAFLIRMTLAIVAVVYLDCGLTAVWGVLAIDLYVRGVLLFSRFYRGKWTENQV